MVEVYHVERTERSSPRERYSIGGVSRRYSSVPVACKPGVKVKSK